MNKKIKKYLLHDRARGVEEGLYSNARTLALTTNYSYFTVAHGYILAWSRLREAGRRAELEVWKAATGSSAKLPKLFLFQSFFFCAFFFCFGRCRSFIISSWSFLLQSFGSGLFVCREIHIFGIVFSFFSVF